MPQFGIASLKSRHDLAVERVNLRTKLIDQPGFGLAAILPHQTVQIAFVIAQDGLDPVAGSLARLRKVRDRGRKSLLVHPDRVQSALNGGLFFRLQVADLAQDGGDSLERIAVFFQVRGIEEEEEVALGAARFEHLDGSLLRERCRGRVHTHDAIDNPAHLKHVIQPQQDDRSEDQSYDSQAERDSPAHGDAGCENREIPAHSRLHLHPLPGLPPYSNRNWRLKPLAHGLVRGPYSYHRIGVENGKSGFWGIFRTNSAPSSKRGQ